VNWGRDMERRDWLRTVGRLGVAVALGGGVGALALRPGRRCEEASLCRGCALLERCELPDAASMRQAVRNEQGWIDARQAEDDDPTGVRA